MKSKICACLFLFLACLCFVFIKRYSAANPPHKVLDVVSADLFYIDLNDDGKIQEDELIKLRDIACFDTKLNYFSKQNAKKLSIDVFDYLKLGFLAKNYAQKLKGEYVYLNSTEKHKIDKNYKYSKVSYRGMDLGEFYLKAGLAHLRENLSDPDYYPQFSPKQIKNNIKEISKIDFVILNPHTNIIHNLNCDFAALMSSGELLPKKEAKNHIPCKSCLDTVYGDIAKITPPKSEKIYKYSLNKTFGALELYLINPLEYKKPDLECKTSICQKIVQEIDNSKESIDIAVYYFGYTPKIKEALLRAKSRGVKIRMILDYSKKMDTSYLATKDYLREFDARTDNSEILLHDKFFIFDKSKIMTGSSNISPTDFSYSANVVVFVKSNDLSSFYEKEFEQMYEGKFSNQKDEIKTNEINLNGVILRPYFLPKTDVLHGVILKNIQNAKEEVFLSAFYLTSDDLIEELIKAKNRGVKVLVLIDSLGAINFKKKLNKLKEAKIPALAENWGGKNHEKTILIDKSILILGSANFTKSGYFKNNENVLLIKNKEIAEFYRDYYLYLFNSIDKKFLKIIPRAEGFDSLNSCSDGLDNNFDGKIDGEDEGCK